MKTSTFLLFLFINCIHLTAQKNIIYLDIDMHPCEKAAAESYEIIKKEGDLFSVKGYHLNGKLLFEGYASNDTEPLIYEGAVKFYSENKQLLSFMEFLHGKPNGKVIDYYSNGKKRRELSYIEGKLNGMNTEYFPTGEIAKQANYINDKQEGEFIQYLTPNSLELKANYKNGMIDGIYEQYSFGKLVAIGTAKDNVQDGFCQEFYDGGFHIWKTYSIKNLLLDGAYFCYNQFGDTIAKGIFKDGVPLSYWSKSNELKRGSEFSNEMNLINSLEYWKTFRDGVLILESYFYKGAKSGYWKLFTKDGKRLYETKLYDDIEVIENHLQSTEENFAWHIQLSNRFDVNTYPFSSDEFSSEHKEYYKTDKYVDLNDDPYYAIKSGDTFETPIMEAIMVVEEAESDYSEQSDTKEFIERNHCVSPYGIYKNVSICNQLIDGFNLYILKCDDIETLKEIKATLIPKDNEVYFLYQNIHPNDYKYIGTRPHRYIDFVMTESMKEAIFNDIINPKLINYYYKNIVFKNSYYPSTDAMSILNKLVKK